MKKLKNGRHEKFCWLYVFGNPAHDPNARPDDPDNPPDTLHNATKSYILAGYKARGNAAAVNGSRLLRREDVRSRIAELEEQAARVAEARIFRWGRLLADAQQVLVDAMTGRREVSSVQLKAARVTIDRAEGPLTHKFRNPKTGKEQVGIPVYVYAGDHPEEE